VLGVRICLDAVFLNGGACMSFQGWGNFPKIHATGHRFGDRNSLRELLSRKTEYIARGNGRSYGDSSLNENLICIRPYDCFLSFDSKKGTISVQAGVLLGEILEVIVPEGWFLPVTPGTKYVTVGGAIASDVHGKNHHLENSFCRYVAEFTMMLPSGDVVHCSRSDNEELFRATCGGMGLTGIILTAEINLKSISSSLIEQTSIKTRNLEETLSAFDTYQDRTYSVAWIDCLARGKALGRGILSVGEHSESGQLCYKNRDRISLPLNFPSFTLNTAAVKSFNTLYYSLGKSGGSRRQVTIEEFFYPLDAIRHWNRIYGKAGFMQYQFVLPLESSLDGLRDVLTVVSGSGQGSPLAVLKLLGESNNNWLSFPMHGYTLALDFRIQRNLSKLLSEMDEIVIKHGGRFYLAKDARVSRKIFEAGYDYVDRFRSLRKQYGMNKKFNSLQSQRVEL
jgi:FAD/FMN-containing dehydrogenase